VAPDSVTAQLSPTGTGTRRPAAVPGLEFKTVFVVVSFTVKVNADGCPGPTTTFFTVRASVWEFVIVQVGAPFATAVPVQPAESRWRSLAVCAPAAVTV